MNKLRRIYFIFKIAIAYASAAALYYWFFCPYNIEGVEFKLPERTFLRHGIAFTLLLIVGACLRGIRIPPAPEKPVLSKHAYWLIYCATSVTFFLIVIRFSVPLLWSKFPFLGAKLSINESLIWSAFFVVSLTALKTLPLYSEKLDPPVDELLNKDHRKPVLYFRSFEKELEKTKFISILWTHMLKLKSRNGGYMFSTSFEGSSPAKRMIQKRSYATNRSLVDEQMIFADAINTIGPYVALGRPTENFKDMDLGAAKEYVSNDEWQTKVIEWIKKCAAVVIEAADSQSLGWELAQIIEMLPPHKILLICPHSDKEYSEFLHAYQSLFPNGLPKERPKSRLLTFDKNWQPIELENINLNIAETLQPFFDKLQFEYLPN